MRGNNNYTNVPHETFQNPLNTNLWMAVPPLPCHPKII
jgi:hypothetical protein